MNGWPDHYQRYQHGRGTGIQKNSTNFCLCQTYLMIIVRGDEKDLNESDKMVGREDCESERIEMLLKLREKRIVGH